MNATRVVVARAAKASLLVLLLLIGCSRTEPGPAAPGARCDAAIETLASGFGARGPHPVAIATIRNPRWPTERVSLHFPDGVADPVPVVFFGHGNDLGEPKYYAALIDHIASTGIAVVFAPYVIGSNLHVDRYDAIRVGVDAAVAEWGDRLDLARVGFVGHSYGAGALPWLARYALVERGWGSEGALLYSLAPWFALAISPEQLRALPAQLRALFVVFEEDNVTDHRIAIAQYQALGEREHGRQYVLLHADEHAGCPLPAPHTLPQSVGLRARDDVYDSRGLFRLFDALAAWAFRGDAAGRDVAFGNGSVVQVDMGHWPDGTPVAKLDVRDDPKPSHAESFYLFRIGERAAWIEYGEKPAAVSPDAAAPAP